MELMNRIYGFFKKVDPRIFCTTESDLAYVKEHYEMHRVFQNTNIVFWLFYSHLLWAIPLPKMKEGQALVLYCIVFIIHLFSINLITRYGKSHISNSNRYS